MIRGRVVGKGASRRDLTAVLAIWGLLLCAASVCLYLLDRNSIRLINRIEYVEIGRYTRMLALYEEAKKRAEEALASLDNSPSRTLPPTQKDYVAAVTLYDRALKLDPRGTLTPEHGEHYRILMRLHEAAGQRGEFLKNAVREALARGDAASAQAFAARLTAPSQKDAEAWYWAVQVPLSAGRWDEASTLTREMAQALPPGAAELHELRGRIAEGRKDLESAVKEFAEVVRLRPADVDSRKKLAVLLMASGRSTEALQHLEAGMDLGGRADGNYMHILGSLLLDLNKPWEAVRALTKAAELEAHSADVMWTLARAHSKAGNSRRAHQTMQRAFELNPELRKRVLEE